MQDLSRHYHGGIADSPIGLAAWLLDHNDADGQPAAAVASTLNRDGGGCGVDDRTTGMIDGRVVDKPVDHASRGRLRALYEWLKPATPSLHLPSLPASAPDRGNLPARIGQYAIERKLGQGGMGVVYAARDERLKRTVALKMMSSLAHDERARTRFWREARVAASVNHPNVCQIYEISEDHGDSLAFSLPDAIATSLSGIGSLIVRSSTTAARFTAATPDLKALAAEADVDRVVIGTLCCVPATSCAPWRSSWRPQAGRCSPHTRCSRRSATCSAYKTTSPDAWWKRCRSR